MTPTLPTTAELSTAIHDAHVALQTRVRSGMFFDGPHDISEGRSRAWGVSWIDADRRCVVLAVAVASDSCFCRCANRGVEVVVQNAAPESAMDAAVCGAIAALSRPRADSKEQQHQWQDSPKSK